VSVTGFWIGGAITPEAVEGLRERVPGLVTASARPGDADDLSWWRAMDDAPLAEPGFACRPSAAAVRFMEAVDAGVPDMDAEACVNAVGEVADEDRFVAAMRKGDPVAALFYGLGFAAARTLPGRSGCFLLTPDEVRAAVPAASAILGMDARRRARVAARIRAWLEVSGDEPDLDVDELVDGMPRMLLRAADLGRGAVGVVQWY
jgi:hypothetical protein